ncbi:MAG: HEAT repeat domain-containing protein, partial [Gemmatimonadota bacterium]
QARVQRDQARVQRDQVRMQRGQEAGDDEMKSAALNALMQVSPDKALPILKQVLANREGNSDALRAQTMFILSQIDSPETFDIMLDAVRNDPSSKVREQAVFWLSKVDSPRAYEALAEILQDPGYSELHQNAIFSLSQSSDPRAHGVLRDYAADASASAESRNAAIHWLGQRPSDENAAFLRDLYSTIPNAESRGQILYALSLMKGHGNAAWLMERALDANEDIELRKIALHWAGQSGEVQMAALIALYDRTDDRDVKEQLIFVYSRRDEAAAMDKLLEIARTEADPELRKNAIFWIGQSGDPRAEDVLLEILTQ